jgi:hypothetical protein
LPCRIVAGSKRCPRIVYSAIALTARAAGLPDSKVGAFTPAFLDEAKKKGWTVISMKNDWRRIFAFESEARSRRSVPWSLQVLCWQWS